jgi:hypothetical protein
MNQRPPSNIPTPCENYLRRNFGEMLFPQASTQKTQRSMGRRPTPESKEYGRAWRLSAGAKKLLGQVCIFLQAAV